MSKKVYLFIFAIFSVIFISYKTINLNAAEINDVEGILPYDDQSIMTTIVTEENQDYYTYLNYNQDLYRIKVFYDQIESGSSENWDSIITCRYAVVATHYPYDVGEARSNNIFYLRFNVYCNKIDHSEGSIIEFQLKITRSMNYIYWFGSGHFWESANPEVCFGLSDIELSFYSSDDYLDRFISYTNIRDFENQPNICEAIYSEIESAIIDKVEIPNYSTIKMIDRFFNYISTNDTYDSNFEQDANLIGLNRKLVKLNLTNPVSYSDNNWDFHRLDYNISNDYDYFGAVYHIGKHKMKKNKEMYININFSLSMTDKNHDLFIRKIGDYKHEVITGNHENTITMHLDNELPHQEINIPFVKSNIQSGGGEYIYYTFDVLKTSDYNFYHTCNNPIDIFIIDEDYNVIESRSSWHKYPSILYYTLEGGKSYFLRIKTDFNENFEFNIVNSKDETDKIERLSLEVDYSKTLNSWTFDYFYLETPSNSNQISYTINSNIVGARTSMWLFDTNGQLISYDYGDHTYNGARISELLNPATTYFILLYLESNYSYDEYSIQFYETNKEVYHLDWKNINKAYFDLIEYDFADFNVNSRVYDLIFYEETKTIVFGRIDCNWSVIYDYHPNRPKEYALGMIIGTTYNSKNHPLYFYSTNGIHDYMSVFPYSYYYTSTVKNVSITFSDLEWSKYVSLGPRK